MLAQYLSIAESEPFQAIRDSMAKRFARPQNPGMELGDLRQEAAVVLWGLVQRHGHLGRPALMALWVRSFHNHLCHILEAQGAKKRQGSVTALLEVRESLECEPSLWDPAHEGIRWSAEVSLLRSRLEGADLEVFDCLWSPPERVTRQARLRRCPRITIQDVALALGMSGEQAKQSFRRVRTLVAEVLA